MSPDRPSPEQLEAQRQLRSGGVAPTARDFVRASGTEAETFLQGQLSADVAALAPTEGVWSLLLAPDGKVDAWLRVSRLGDNEFLLDTDAGWGEAVISRLARFKLRTKIELVPEPDWMALAVRGPVEVELDHAADQPVLAVPAPAPGLIGWDILAPADAHVSLNIPTVGAEALEAVRIECGVPAMGAELSPATIPAEAGQWLIDASVAFNKGCFVGQELVARIDSRGGNVPRPLRGLVLDGAEAPNPGDSVYCDGSEVGVVTSTAYSAALDAPVALAALKRSVDPPAGVVVATGGSELAAEARELPLVDDIPDGPGNVRPVESPVAVRGQGS